ncbi:hypothetical protein ACFP1Z_10785 [Streptomyces gamaensis]|uniref:Adhesin domain-containing protein n=1 Tax=Streptomyces gamaensis TaxID=1763542 RepID=A0ABW0Z0U1_9ACTN
MNIRARLIPVCALALAAPFALGACSAVTGGGEITHEKRDFSYTGRKLSIRAANSEVKLETGDSGKVHVERKMEGKAGDGGNSEWGLDGSTLTLTTDCKGISISCSGSYSVTVPKGVAVELTSTAGAVTAQGFTQPLSLDVKNASVTARDVSGKLGMTVRGGNAVAEGVRSEEVSASSSNGRVKVAFTAVPKKVVVSAGNGNANVTLPQGDEEYRVVTKAVNGQAKSTVPDTRGSSRSVEVTSQNGSVRVDRAQ